MATERGGEPGCFSKGFGVGLSSALTPRQQRPREPTLMTGHASQALVDRDVLAVGAYPAQIPR
jgi:hypothetical protein